MNDLMQNRFFRLALVVAGLLFLLGLLLSFAMADSEKIEVILTSAVASIFIITLTTAIIWALSPKG